MDIVELAQQQKWSPAEFRSQVVRAAAAIGSMELEQRGACDELVLSGHTSDGVVQELVMRRFSAPVNERRH